MHDPRLLRVSNWLVDYPFAERLQRRTGCGEARAAVGADRHSVRRRCGVPAAEGGSLRTVASIRWSCADHVHKEEELDDVERLYPAGVCDDRRQAAHSRQHEEDLGRSAHDDIPARALCDKSEILAQIRMAMCSSIASATWSSANSMIWSGNRRKAPRTVLAASQFHRGPRIAACPRIRGATETAGAGCVVP